MKGNKFVGRNVKWALSETENVGDLEKKSTLKSSNNFFSSGKHVGTKVSSQKESTLKETIFVIVQTLINHSKKIIPVIFGSPPRIQILCSVYNIMGASKMFHSFSFHTCYSSANNINAPCVYCCLQPIIQLYCIRCSSISNDTFRRQAALFTSPRAAASSNFLPRQTCRY